MTDAARVATMQPMRFFNTEGPVRPDDHYCIPPLERIDLDAVLRLIRDKKYFVLHAPRQTGKTSALLALRDLLNAAGDYRCVYADFEVGQAAREDTARAMRALLGELARRARVTLGDGTPDALRGSALETEGADGALVDVLSRWAGADPRPLVLLIDEIDSLIGDTLVSVLRQLRAGYDERPARLPAQRRPVRRGGRARLPHPVERRERAGPRGQRVQRQVEVAAARRLHGGGGALAARPAHRGDRTGVHRGCGARRSGRAPPASRGW